jgi:hypothetical protein
MPSLGPSRVHPQAHRARTLCLDLGIKACQCGLLAVRYYEASHFAYPSALSLDEAFLLWHCVIPNRYS